MARGVVDDEGAEPHQVVGGELAADVDPHCGPAGSEDLQPLDRHVVVENENGGRRAVHVVVQHDPGAGNSVVAVRPVRGERDRVGGVGGRPVDGEDGVAERAEEARLLVGDPDLAAVVRHEVGARHREVGAGHRERDAVLPRLRGRELPRDGVGGVRGHRQGRRGEGELGVRAHGEDHVAVRSDRDAVPAPAVVRLPRRSRPGDRGGPVRHRQRSRRVVRGGADRAVEHPRAALGRVGSEGESLGAVVVRGDPVEVVEQLEPGGLGAPVRPGPVEAGPRLEVVVLVVGRQVDEAVRLRLRLHPVGLAGAVEGLLRSPGGAAVLVVRNRMPVASE